MVDWEAVERLRARGWEWERIAADPSVGTTSGETPREAGRSLRKAYYRRISERAGTDPSTASSKTEAPVATRWKLARVGYFVAPLFGIWFLLAWLIPSPVGAYFSAIPVLGLLAAVAAFVLFFGLLRSSVRWDRTFRTTLVLGIAAGLGVSGTLGVVAFASGCPFLTPVSSGEPQGWLKVANAPWQENGLPVVFFYGSAACPYCSASSWAISMALERLGSLHGTLYGHSSLTDTPANIPEVVLAGATYQSANASFEVAESTSESQITAPSVGECIEQAYASAYGHGAIPFVVVNGQYVHSGSLVDPNAIQTLTPIQVQASLNVSNGAAYNAVSPAAYLLMAFIVHTNGGRPASLAIDPHVAPWLSQIS
ncbi:MAG: DUF929 domain-containing protein [Thermoplasmata archaeon]|nr:DUF929 domain-containing protein [Thermoplasmata archaeon]